MTTRAKQSTAAVVNQMRRLEATIINAGRHGVTIDDLTAAVGVSRRTIDRLLTQLEDLGSDISLDWQPGPVAGTWRHSGQAVFVHRRGK